MNYIKTLSELFKLKKQAKFNREQISVLQNKKLRKLLHFAWENSTYYRKSFERAGITEEELDILPVSCFPTISKKELLENFDELVTDSELTQEDLRKYDARHTVDRNAYRGKYHIVHSSGSTGKPGYFIYDEKAWNTMLLGIIRAALWGMSMPEILKLLWKKPRIVYIAATDGRYGGAMAVGDGIDNLKAVQMYLDINEPLEEWVRKLKDFKPNIVIGYPSAVKILGELIEKDLIHLEIERIITCGEPLGESLRNYLENLFESSVINFYGASESLALGVEADSMEGMLLFDDLNLIEVENGRMFLTCLYNYTQPLIRYELTDNLTLEKAEKSAKYAFTKAIGLIGRNEDILWFSDDNGREEFLHPLAIEGFCVQGLKDYQFRKTGRDSFEMYAETMKNADEDKIRAELTGQMRQILESKGLGYVKFYMIFVEKIQPLPGTGKKPLILPEREDVGKRERNIG